MPAIWKMQLGTPEEARMPEVSLALDGLTLDGRSRAQDPCIILVILGCSILRLGEAM